ncbi:hypothetical protein ACTFIW_005342 [Dictyostelium discoideum]
MKVSLSFLLTILIVIITIKVNLSQEIKISPFFANNLKFEPIPDYIEYDSDSDAGEALFLSNYLDDHKTAKQKSCVNIGAPFQSCDKLLEIDSNLRDTEDFFTFTGFITVNETYNSNTFFWFLESQNGDKNSPLVIFLQGGPGGASTFSLFVETGPYELLDNFTLVPREITWNSEFAMLYIDNPVGTGFSFTDSQEGYSNNEDEIATNLYTFLQQFYKLYPEYYTNELYITGESYAGKYIPAFSYHIIQQNQNSNNPNINLKGIAIGDGLCDPITQVTQYANLAFYTGLADLQQQEVMFEYQDKIVEAINQEQWSVANDLFTDLINGPPDYFQNITGESDYYDIRKTVEPTYGGDFTAFLNQSSIRAMIHVGNNYFQNNNDVYIHLEQDIPKSVKQLFPTILDNIKVILYNGQFDFIVGPSLTETMIRTIEWEGIQPFLESPKIIWKIPSDNVDVAGFVRQWNSFTQVVVRQAGHMVPLDQPARAFDMIDRFINNEPFPSG